MLLRANGDSLQLILCKPHYLESNHLISNLMLTKWIKLTEG